MELELIEEGSPQCASIVDGGASSIIGFAILLGAAIAVALIVRAFGVDKNGAVSPNKGSVVKGENKVEIPVETGKNEVSVEILDGIISSHGIK